MGVFFIYLFPPVFTDPVFLRFGIGILHRHFDVAANERLVEVNQVSTPWRVGDAERTGGKIAPTSWLFKGNQLIPYEFRFVRVNAGNSPEPQPADYPQFLQDLAGTLRQLKLQRYLSLTVHPSPGYQGSVEFTAGRANVSLLPHEVRRDVEFELLF